MAKPTLEELRQYAGRTHELLQRYTHAEIEQGVREAREGITQARPGFMDRFKASFAPSPEAEADIYKSLGYKARPRGEDVVIDKPGGGYINVDPAGLDWGDIADVGGELPSIALGTGGGLLAGLGGLVTGPGALAAAAAGSAAGSAAGELGRQQIAQYFGAEQPTDWGRVGTEAVLGAAGEGVGKLLARPLRGLVSKARRTTRSGPAGLTGPEVPVQPEIAQTLDDLGAFDLRFGTQLEARAPLDVQTQSEMVGEFQQRIRESPGGGRRVRENIDKPFAQEVERGYEAMGRAQGIDPITQEQRLGVGSRLQEAATKTKTDPEFGRLATRRRRYEAFEELVDPNAEPDLSNTQKAIQEILKSKIMRRELVGTAGLEDLNKAIEAAQKIQTFDRLNLEREALNDQIDPKSWATPMAGGPQGLMKRLWTGLNDDWEAFLEAGGKKSTRPGADAPDPPPTIDLDIKTAQAARAVGETLTPNQIVRGMGGLQPSELKRIKGAMDVDRGMASAIGKLRGRPGMTIEEMLENVRGSEQGDSIFRAAGIESADDFMEAIRTKSFFQKFQAGAESFERGATREQAEAARGQIGPLFERIENAGTVDDLQAIAREFEEARAAGIVDVEDLTVANDEIGKRYQTILERTVAPKTDIPDIGLPSQAALEAGKAARSYASGLYKIDESSVVGRLFRNEETWSDIPARLTKGEGLTPEEIRGLKRYIGAEGVKEKGIDPSVRGQKAWTDLQSSVLEDIKKASIWRGARYAKTTPGQFVIDGQKMVRKLDDLKPGALDEIFGPVLADDLTRFANMVEGAQKSEKQFGNISGTGSNNASMFNMALLGKLFSGAPQTAIADILGRTAASTGGGLALGTRTGVDLLTGQTGWQRGLKARPRLLETLGRVGGLTTVQGAQSSTGAR